MTAAGVFELLEGMRVRIVEGQMRVRIEVPRSFVGVARAVSGDAFPVYVVATFAPLAWWRCRLKRQQLVRGERGKDGSDRLVGCSSR